MPQSPSLGFELLTSNQDSKHVTVNASALILEAVSIGVVVDQLNTPPVAPTNGQLYIVGTAGTGAFLGQNNKLALYDSTTWYFYSPKTNQTLYNTSLASYVRFGGSTWASVSLGGSSYVSPTTTKGDLIVRNTSADQRLPVGANGQLLTADSAESTGVKWVTPSAGAASPTTTAGDLIVRNATVDQRLPVGSNGSFLVVDTALPEKIKWVAPPVSTAGNYIQIDLDGASVSSFGTTPTASLFGGSSVVTGSPGLTFSNTTGTLVLLAGTSGRWRFNGVIFVQATTVGTRFQFSVGQPVSSTPAVSPANVSIVGGGVVTTATTPTPVTISGFLDLPAFAADTEYSIQVRASAAGSTLSATNPGAGFPVVSRVVFWKV